MTLHALIDRISWTVMLPSLSSASSRRLKIVIWSANKILHHFCMTYDGKYGHIETICEQGDITKIFDITKNKRVQRLAARKKVLALRQHDEMDLGEYLEKFEILVSVAAERQILMYTNCYSNA